MKKSLNDYAKHLPRTKRNFCIALLALLGYAYALNMQAERPQREDYLNYVPTFAAIKVGAYTLGSAAVIPHAVGYWTEKKCAKRPKGALSSQGRLKRVFEPWRAIPLTGAIAACYVADKLLLGKESNLRYAMYPLALGAFTVGAYQALQESEIPYNGFSTTSNDHSWLKNFGKFLVGSLGGAFVAHKLFATQSEPPKKKKKRVLNNGVIVEVDEEDSRQ